MIKHPNGNWYVFNEHNYFMFTIFEPTMEIQGFEFTYIKSEMTDWEISNCGYDWKKQEEIENYFSNIESQIYELAVSISGERDILHVKEIPNMLAQGYTCITTRNARIDHQTRYGTIIINKKTKNFIIDSISNVSEFAEFLPLTEQDQVNFSKPVPQYMELRDIFTPYNF